MNIQTLLVLGALMLIGAITVFVNRNMFDTSERVTEANIMLTATGLGEAELNKAISYRFDEVQNASTPTQLTTPSTLGADQNERYPLFDDFDDYNNLDVSITSNGTKYQILGRVFYVTKNNLTTQQTAATNFKRLILKVKSNYLYRLPDSSITLTYVSSYQRMFK